MGRVETALGELRGLLTGRSTVAAPATGPDIEAIARAEIERGQQAQAAADAEARREGRLAAAEAKLAKLAETKPKPPVRRITKFMWPGHAD